MFATEQQPRGSRRDPLETLPTPAPPEQRRRLGFLGNELPALPNGFESGWIGAAWLFRQLQHLVAHVTQRVLAGEKSELGARYASPTRFRKVTHASWMRCDISSACLVASPSPSACILSSRSS